jgi:gliding motility-associated lipoprotein GldH
VLMFFSCTNVYRDFQDVKNLKWYRTDIKTFEFDIKEDGNYDLFFHMRHSTGYPFTTIKTKISMTLPDKTIYEKEAEFPVADESGRYIGEVAGDLWDIENAFSENYFMKKGKYKINIAHAMENDPVILVVDIGLIIKKTE